MKKDIQELRDVLTGGGWSHLAQSRESKIFGGIKLVRITFENPQSIRPCFYYYESAGDGSLVWIARSYPWIEFEGTPYTPDSMAIQEIKRQRSIKREARAIARSCGKQLTARPRKSTRL